MRYSAYALLIASTVLNTQLSWAHSNHQHIEPTDFANKDSLVVPMNALSLDGNTVAGKVYVSQSPYGLVFAPKLQDMEAGIYGFHVHENPSCAPKEKNGKMVLGLGAGGHWDPKGTGQHLGPWRDGHLGDLPALAIDAKGNAQPVVAPKLKSLDELRGHALIIHAGGDNYSDHPHSLGGGGARVFCGVIN